MDVLVVGGGGREHTLAWKLNESPMVDTVYCAPGNPAWEGVSCIGITDWKMLADFAESQKIGLTVVGPEVPLCDGIVNIFRKQGLTVFGPDSYAAQLEGSKVFAKKFMEKHGIPTAAYGEFDNLADSKAYVEKIGAPLVVKADGLAAGKGVTVAQTNEEAIAALEDCFTGAFGEAGSKVIIEECLVGEEASILAFCDGKTIVPLASSQDHKAVGEGDTGPNTGGMGAYSPAPVVDDALWESINKLVLDRFLKGCQEDELDFHGVIYAGIMMTKDGPKVLEFNVRFGDPETQAVLPRLESDLCEAMLAVAEERLSEVKLAWSDKAAVCIVLAAGGYPGKYEKGSVIFGLEEAAQTGAVVFHAGTKKDDNVILTNGGRVLGVTALGNSIQEAVDGAYKGVECIHWENMYFRKDIAHRALSRKG